MTRNAPAESLLVRDKGRRRRADALQCLVMGTVGECLSYRIDSTPLWRWGMLLVVVEYAIHVSVSVYGNTPAPKNISICGFLELVPNWVAFLYSHVAAAGIDCTLWASVAIAKKEAQEGNKALGIMRALLTASCAVCLAGFSAVPRCLWTVHQNFVLFWVVATSVAMFVGLIRDRKLEGYSVFPFVLWSVGTYFCITFYYESSIRFYTAEATTVVAYILWCSNGHLLYNRKKFSAAHFLVLDGVIGVILLRMFRYNQTNVCTVTGQWKS